MAMRENFQRRKDRRLRAACGFGDRPTIRGAPQFGREQTAQRTSRLGAVAASLEARATRGGCGVAGSVPSLGVATALARYPRSVPSLARGICAGCGWWVRRIGSLSHLGGRRRSCDGAASALRRRAMDYALCTMDYALCTMHYGLWTMDYGLIASPTNAERCRGTAGQLRWAIGASAVHWRVSLSSLLAFLI